jgi:TetR/AcrR family transcriptional repressor of nem operon
MPWEEQFDVEQALTEALELFWTKGYESTSLQDLLKTMKITRGSFYNTFKGKRELFLRALEHYRDCVVGPVFGKAATESNPLDAIAAVFRMVLKDSLSRQGRKGCLFVNTALEVGPQDKEIGDLVRVSFEGVEAFFCSKLEEAREQGLVQQKADARKSAASLLALLLGMRVLARAGAGRATLESVVTQAENTLCLI